jgi:predicted DNA-binding transcriptional regulator AlpA
MKTIQVQLAITLDEVAVKSLIELLAPSIKQAIEPPTSQFDQKGEARLRACRQALFGGEKPPEDQGLLIDSKEAVKLLKVSSRTLWEMQATGRMPPPVRIGRAVRWSLETLKKWIEDGCPAVR